MGCGGSKLPENTTGNDQPNKADLVKESPKIETDENKNSEGRADTKEKDAETSTTKPQEEEDPLVSLPSKKDSNKENADLTTVTSTSDKDDQNIERIESKEQAIPNGQPATTEIFSLTETKEEMFTKSPNSGGKQAVIENSEVTDIKQATVDVSESEQKEALNSDIIIAESSTSSLNENPPKIEQTTNNTSNYGNQPETSEADSKENTMQDQEMFDIAVRFASRLVKSDEILNLANKNIRKLHLARALPPHIDLLEVLSKLTHVEEVDLSNNNMGPQSFRVIVLALAQNTTITKLTIANNMTDTDSAMCLGKMLSSNSSLTHLDVSGNTLGRDYFSRCVGPALKSNKVLQVLKLSSIGATDLKVLLENAVENESLNELDLSHNELADGAGLGASLSEWLKRPCCALTQLNLRSCGLKGDGMDQLAEGVQGNELLQTINVGANQVCSFNTFMYFLVSCMGHPKMTSVNMDDMRVENMGPWGGESIPNVDNPSSITTLSMASCNLRDDLWDTLSKKVPGKLQNLIELNLNNNPDLSTQTWQALQGLFSDDSSLQRLSIGLNSAAEVLDSLPSLPSLTYLNLRKASVQPATTGKLAPFLMKTAKPALETLVVDGLKLSHNESFSKILEASAESSLTAFSASGCVLDDKDLKTISTALKNGLPLLMLKLSNNKISDTGIEDLVGDLVSMETHPLALVDLSVNSIQCEGAQHLAKLFTSGSHKSNIHTLNLSNNSIDHVGVKSLVGLVTKTSLNNLNISNQQTSFNESDVQEIQQELCGTLGFSISEVDGEIQGACNSLTLSSLSRYTTVNMSGLGGNAGPLGRMLDCTAIITDYKLKQLPHLGLGDALKLASAFKGYNSPKCLLSGEEWTLIIGERDSPSWLQVPKHRDTALYMSSLPAIVTVQKMEAILEMEADCEVQEVCLMKDPVIRKNNGLAWVLLSDAKSVERAVEFFQRGEAQLFGQSFTISSIAVEVDDQANTEAEGTARHDMEKRLAERKVADSAHRQLIQESYEISQARHAYLLANPAYADGRVW